MVIMLKFVTGSFKMQFQFDWFISMSDYKLSDCMTGSQLVENMWYFKLVTFEGSVIFMIK